MSDEQDMGANASKVPRGDGVLTHVIISTGSGTGEAEDFWVKTLQPILWRLENAQARPNDVHITDSDTSISRLVETVLLPAANAGKFQVIFLLSGDGGVVDLVNGLLDESVVPRSKKYSRPLLFLFPLGTGNALAHSAGITRDQKRGLSRLGHGTPDPLPVFQVTFSHDAKLLANEGREERQLSLAHGMPTVYGVVVCSWGLHAGLVADSDTVEYRKLGSERFKIAAKENLFPSDGSEAHHYKGEVKLLRRGSKDWEGVQRTEHAYVLATFCSHLEQGFNISPASEPLDGKLRLVHFGALGGKDVMEIMGAAYQGGKHVDDARVGYEEIDGLRIEFAEEDAKWRRVCVDGKIIVVEKGGWVEVKIGPKGVLDLMH
ncbi:hypothetical protein LTR95_005118 [Oleoguttula sp. CCFEE 5521]